MRAAFWVNVVHKYHQRIFNEKIKVAPNQAGGSTALVPYLGVGTYVYLI